ncbi:hypothetical protein ACHQM5_024126 [Ranunculus cassubicifolius]
MSGEAHHFDTRECCMCGDYGLSENLFRCSVCLSRFQHSYCSNLYPRAGNYKVCNWCLSKRDGDRVKQIQISHSSANRNNSHQRGEEDNKIIKRSVPLMKVKRDDVHIPIKKQRVNSDEFNGRKKIVYGGAHVSKPEVTVKTVFRVKVQRYKLLEEVSVR